jgi:hypothetical protein
MSTSQPSTDLLNIRRCSAAHIPDHRLTTGFHNGWRFSVKYVPSIIRDRNAKS